MKRLLKLFRVTGIKRIRGMVYIFFKDRIWEIGFKREGQF